MPPSTICTRNSAVTTQKYFAVAFMDGVGLRLRSGSLSGTWGAGSLP